MYGIIKLMYTKMTVQLANLNTKPLCGKYLQVMIAFLVGVRYYPQENTKHYQSLYLDCCHISKYYLRHGRTIPVSSVSSWIFIFHFSPFIFDLDFFYITKKCDPFILIQGPHSSVLECGRCWFRQSSIRISSRIPRSPFTALTTPSYSALPHG
jgi:hypothetical protein